MGLRILRTSFVVRRSLETNISQSVVSTVSCTPFRLEQLVWVQLSPFHPSISTPLARFSLVTSMLIRVTHWNKAESRPGHEALLSKKLWLLSAQNLEIMDLHIIPTPFPKMWMKHLVLLQQERMITRETTVKPCDNVYKYPLLRGMRWKPSFNEK